MYYLQSEVETFIKEHFEKRYKQKKHNAFVTFLLFFITNRVKKAEKCLMY
jgi:hypothetical protein